MNRDTSHDTAYKERSSFPGRFLIPALCIIMIVILACGLYYAENVHAKKTVIPQTTSREDTGPAFPEEVSLCSDTAMQLYHNEVSVNIAVKTDNPYRCAVLEYDMKARSGTLLISERPDFSGATEYPMEAFRSVFRIDNLKTGTRYYYKAIIDGVETTGSFQTLPSTRFVSIPGAYVTRDIGGYQNLDGKTVRQGLLIRGTEMDGLEYELFTVLPEDIAAARKTFGFVYDFDLRPPQVYKGTDYRSPLGDDVGHKFYSAPQYANIFDETRFPQIAEIFADLADPQKYPMYMHCTWGKDQTGTIILLLQGILNMSEEDMLREYYITGYSFSNMTTDKQIDPVVEGLQKYTGDTLAEKIVTYLTEDVGVTQEQIQAIRDIFLTP